MMENRAVEVPKSNLVFNHQTRYLPSGIRTHSVLLPVYNKHVIIVRFNAHYKLLTGRGRCKLHVFGGIHNNVWWRSSVFSLPLCVCVCVCVCVCRGDMEGTSQEKGIRSRLFTSRARRWAQHVREGGREGGRERQRCYMKHYNCVCVCVYHCDIDWGVLYCCIVLWPLDLWLLCDSIQYWTGFPSITC